MKKPKFDWLTRVAAFALVLSLAAACEDDTTGPGATDDPAGTADIVGDLVASLEGNPTLQTYNEMAGVIAMTLGGGPIPAPLQLDEEPRHLGESLARFAPVCSLDEPSAPLAGPIIPTEIRGVYIWNVDLGYVLDELADYPFDPDVDGVRFILYMIDPITGPDPEQPVGYVDFIDLSPSETSLSLRVIVAPTGGAPVVDYTVGCAEIMGGLELSGAGFVSDGTTRIDLDLSVKLMFLSGIEIDFTLASRGFEIHFFATAADPEEFEFEYGTWHAEFSVKRNNSIEFTADVLEGDMTAVVEFCDAAGSCVTVAEITDSFYDEFDPVITDVEGNELSLEAKIALGMLFEFAGDFVDNLFPMLEPAAGLCFSEPAT
ncbi:MAG: hypothetical protein JSV86_03315 [Gemmatimonadota bacterium]|nr:MAG: hypothetical protein JSV86_03315 [Gemmatimonadota bacterium]